MLDRATRRPGVPSARLAVAFLDPRSESPGESYSRVVMHERGLPRPELQYEILDDNGLLVARCDFAWPDRRTVGEFDGLREVLRSSWANTNEVVVTEKRREDAIRSYSWQVARWIWADLDRPAELAGHAGPVVRSGPATVTVGLRWAARLDAARSCTLSRQLHRLLPVQGRPAGARTHQTCSRSGEQEGRREPVDGEAIHNLGRHRAPQLGDRLGGRPDDQGLGLSTGSGGGQLRGEGGPRGIPQDRALAAQDRAAEHHRDRRVIQVDPSPRPGRTGPTRGPDQDDATATTTSPRAASSTSRARAAYAADGHRAAYRPQERRDVGEPGGRAGANRAGRRCDTEFRAQHRRVRLLAERRAAQRVGEPHRRAPLDAFGSPGDDGASGAGGQGDAEAVRLARPQQSETVVAQGTAVQSGEPARQLLAPEELVGGQSTPARQNAARAIAVVSIRDPACSGSDAMSSARLTAATTSATASGSAGTP